MFNSFFIYVSSSLLSNIIGNVLFCKIRNMGSTPILAFFRIKERICGILWKKKDKKKRKVLLESEGLESRPFIFYFKIQFCIAFLVVFVKFFVFYYFFLLF